MRKMALGLTIYFTIQTFFMKNESFLSELQVRLSPEGIFLELLDAPYFKSCKSFHVEIRDNLQK